MLAHSFHNRLCVIGGASHPQGVCSELEDSFEAWHVQLAPLGHVPALFDVSCPEGLGREYHWLSSSHQWFLEVPPAPSEEAWQT